MEPLLSVKVPMEMNGRISNVGFTKYGNRHLYSDTFGRSKSFNRGDLLGLEAILRSSTYITSTDISKTRKDRISRFHYFKATLHGNTVYLNVAEETKRLKNGQTRKERYLYSVTDRIK